VGGIVLSLGPGPGALQVLALGAHPDDIEIGCGGTLLTLADRPATTVRCAVLTGTPARRDEARAASRAFAARSELDWWDFPDGRLPAHWDAVKDALHALATRTSPDIVLCPRADDAHQDHRLLGRLAPTVWRDALVLHYEIAKWDADLTPPTHYVPLTPDQARHKVELLYRCYPSQHGRDWWDEELFLGLMRVRGVECKSRYAEAFHASKVLVAVE
jgi:LmbE family N-acetylglucosaminyl deacetylase